MINEHRVVGGMRIDRGKNTLRKTSPMPLCLQQTPCHKGRAIAQAVSRWLPKAAARVRARVWPCGICGGQSGAGAGFL
jgi:hypothetical protein